MFWMQIDTLNPNPDSESFCIVPEWVKQVEVVTLKVTLKNTEIRNFWKLENSDQITFVFIDSNLN